MEEDLIFLTMVVSVVSGLGKELIMKKNGFSDLKCSCYQTILMEFGTNNGSHSRSRFQ